MKKLILLLAILPFIISCNGQGKTKYKYSENETKQYLEEIVKNAKVTIGDITESNKQPTEKVYSLTRYPLTKETVDDHNKNN